MDSACFDGLAAAFFAVDEDDAEFDVAAFTFDDVDGFESGAAGGDDVVDDDDVLTGGEVSFDLFSCAVAFWFLADGEDLDCFVGVLVCGRDADGEGDGVGPECHAANGLDGEFFGMDFRADRVPADIADHGCAERVHGGDAAVDVEIGLLSRGEDEASGADGFFEQEGFEVGCGLEHGGGFRVLGEDSIAKSGEIAELVGEEL